MKPNPELNYWLEIKNEEEAIGKILVGSNWKERTKQDIDKIKNKLGIAKTDNILDFGCGMGRLIKEIAPLCKNIVGIDISDAMIMYAYKYCLGLKNVTLSPMQCESVISLEDKDVNKIYSFLTLQHILKPKAFKLLNEFNRILKKFGRVLIQYPNVLNKKFYFTYMNQTENLGIISPLIEFYSKEEIKMIYNIMGFEILDMGDDGKDFYVLAEKVKDVPKLPTLAIIPTIKKEKARTVQENG